MTSNEFGQRPFAAGSLTGLRAFAVTDSGGLTGVIHRDLWDAGVNTAQCHASAFPAILVPYVKDTGVEFEAREHQYVGLGCTCGWYAYFDGGNDYMRPSWRTSSMHLAGIVEGWGKCVVGSRGFRCEKVVIKALLVPAGHTEDGWESLLPLVRDRYPLVPWFDTQAEALAEFPLTVPAGVDQ